MNADTLKSKVRAVVDAEAAPLLALSHQIHAHPEVAFQEVQASGWLADYLEGHGFAVERGLCDLPTAFVARKGSGAPVVAFLAEYDALPGIGHGCGHNIIGTASAGAGVALAAALAPGEGTVVVFGTPAEEGGAGKVIMLRGGAFAGIDVAMEIHPSGHRDLDGLQAVARATVTVAFHGRASHAASAPEQGINALDALVLGYMGVAQLRQHIRPSERIHGIITDGGLAPNIVPAYAAGRFYVRARTERELEPLKERVLACFRAGAEATGARLEATWTAEQTSELWTNEPLAAAYRANAAALGRTVLESRTLAISTVGSTDVGNVSKAVPTIHPMIRISDHPVAGHSLELTAAAASPLGDQAVLDGAKALAMTGADVIADPSLLEAARRAFADMSDE